jgi:hypothetical protein
MEELDRRPDRPSVAERARRLRRVRAKQNKIGPLMPGISKVDLARALWPVLEAKVERRGSRVPIVRVLERAIELAEEWPRGNVAIPLRAAGR